MKLWGHKKVSVMAVRRKRPTARNKWALTVACGAIGIAVPAQSATIRHMPVSKTVEAIVVEGELVPSDIDKFREVSLQFKSAMVILDSQGGALSAGIEIGKMIRLTGYSTLVPANTTCTSSCALIWLAGSRRFLSPDGKVGFHASYTDRNGRLEETGVGNAMVGHYLSLLNLPQKAVIFATMAGPDEITWLTRKNKALAGIEFEDFILDDEPEDTPAAAHRAGSMASTSLPSSSKSLPRLSLVQIENLLRTELRKPASLEKIVFQAKLDQRAASALRDHITKLYANDPLIRHMAKELYEAQDNMTGQNAFEMSREIGKEITQKLSSQGLRRLSDDEVKMFFGYFALIASKAAPGTCKAIFSGTGSDGLSEYQILANSGPAIFSNYLTLMRKSIFAELADTPSVVTVSESQKKLGTQAFERVLGEATAELPQADKDRISTALDDLDKASDRDACDAYYLMFRAMYDMGGMPGAWFRRDMAKAMAE